MGYPKCCIDFGDKLSGNVGKKDKVRKNLIWSEGHIRSFMESDKVSRLLNIYTG